jgi:hypothetical protein
MTLLEQAARQALEALQLCANGTDDVLLTRDALAALRQALDQPKQEPAAWQWMGTGHYRKHLPKDAEKYCWKPLYTEPPKSNWQEIECPCCGDLARAFPPAPKREWGGLTDSEIMEALTDLPHFRLYFLQIARAVEGALKEKNT